MKKKTSVKKTAVYSTGIPGIDAQHEELFELCGGLQKLLRSKKKPAFEEIVVFLDIISGCLKSHFAVERSLFEMTGFPGAKEHEEAHEAIFNKLAEETETFKKEKNTGLDVFITSFGNALLEHMGTNDKEYADHVENLISLRKKYKITALTAQKLTE